MSGSTPLTVLVVEDYDDSRYLWRVALEKHGYRVLEASDGREAVKVALRERPEIILMDLSLPIMDGLAATKRIRQAPKTRATLIIAVTAHQESNYRKQALDAGCDAYVTKPIDFDWLNDLIGQLLPKDSE